MVYNILLTLHITGGFAALLSAFVAVGSKWIDVAHSWHIWSGRVYHWGMIIVFVTALPMTFLRPNLFLFLIAIFSYYMVFMGWRMAINRRGIPGLSEWIAIGLMLVSGVGMLLYGIYALVFADSADAGIILLVFGVIGFLNGYNDLRLYRSGALKGKARIAEHLSHMLGGTIATITAFVVTNFYFEPVFVLWLAPTALITPIIVYWTRQVKGVGRGLTKEAV